jgi:hypothetical protein
VAHLRPLEKCSCGKPATAELRDSRNNSYGKFCDSCGKRRLREIAEREAKDETNGVRTG